MRDPSLSTPVRGRVRDKGPAHHACLLFAGMTFSFVPSPLDHDTATRFRGADPLVCLQGAEGAALLRALPTSFVRVHPADPAVQCAPYSVVELLLTAWVHSASALSLTAHALDPGTLLGLARHRSSTGFA